MRGPRAANQPEAARRTVRIRDLGEAVPFSPSVARKFSGARLANQPNAGRGADSRGTAAAAVPRDCRGPGCERVRGPCAATQPQAARRAIRIRDHGEAVPACPPVARKFSGARPANQPNAGRGADSRGTAAAAVPRDCRGPGCERVCERVRGPRAANQPGAARRAIAGACGAGAVPSPPACRPSNPPPDPGHGAPAVRPALRRGAPCAGGRWANSMVAVWVKSVLTDAELLAQRAQLGHLALVQLREVLVVPNLKKASLAHQHHVVFGRQVCSLAPVLRHQQLSL